MGSDDSLQGSSFEFYMIYRKPHPLSLSHTHTHTNTYSLSRVYEKLRRDGHEADDVVFGVRNGG